jgi:hypothetical protein
MAHENLDFGAGGNLELLMLLLLLAFAFVFVWFVVTGFVTGFCCC